MSEAEGVRSLKLQIIYCFALSLSVCESAVQHPKNRLTWDFSLPLVRSRKCWVWIWNRCNNSLLRSDYIFSLIRLLPPALIALRGVLFVPPRESPPPPPLMTQKNKIWRVWLGMFGQFWSNSPVAQSMVLGAVAPPSARLFAYWFTTKTSAFVNLILGTNTGWGWLVTMWT